MSEFDRSYWEHHWEPDPRAEDRRLPVNPYIPAETGHLRAGTALDAGCGAGAEAIWLAEHGWRVTAVDIAPSALSLAARRAALTGVAEQVEWVQADLTRWDPRRTWDLVTTSYAHADIGQLSFYQRIASWVAIGGTLLIVGHLHGDRRDGHRGHDHPEDATATLDDVANLFSGPGWQADSGYENTRLIHPGDHRTQLRDLVFRAHRVP